MKNHTKDELWAFDWKFWLVIIVLVWVALP